MYIINYPENQNYIDLPRLVLAYDWLGSSIITK